MSNEIKVTLNNENVILVKAQRGVEGARGADGAEGPKGDGLDVLSIYPTLLDLQTAHPIGSKGDCYAVGTSSSNEVYFWDIDNSEWSNLGSIMGPPGADGSIGVDGKSAYEIALDNGFVGTESQWIDSLVGADGTNGADGADGKSAYQSALNGGFVGTELEFNEALAEVKNKQSLLVSGTNIKTINGNPILGSGDLVIATSSDWNAITATLTYASADSPTFVANTSIDLTAVISVGMKLKLTQATVKYFIVTAITSTTITLYGGTDYTLANATITLPYFSSMKSPFGFPLNPAKWTVTVTDATQRSQANAVQNTWYNMGNVLIDIPIGLWFFDYNVLVGGSRSSGAGLAIFVTLSTANNTQSNSALTMSVFSGVETVTTQYFKFSSYILSALSKTRYYLNTMTDSTGTIVLFNNNHQSDLVIKAVCAYL